MKSILITILFALCLGIGSCREKCGIIAEPTLSLNFASMTTPRFKNIIMQGAIKDLPNAGTARPSPGGQYGNIYLPINLNATSTTYIFEQQQRTDTLTVYYKVVVRNVSLVCGNILDIDSTTIKPKTTFKKVTVNYGSYYGQQGFFGYNGGNGLTVNIIEL